MRILQCKVGKVGAFYREIWYKVSGLAKSRRESSKHDEFGVGSRGDFEYKYKSWFYSDFGFYKKIFRQFFRRVKSEWQFLERRWLLRGWFGGRGEDELFKSLEAILGNWRGRRKFKRGRLEVRKIGFIKPRRNNLGDEDRVERWARPI